MIVRNEEAFLPNCLGSLANIVDDVIVVDTGSTDSTRSIAAAFGAKLIEFPWTGDFAAARNRGLEEIKSGWVLYIDADECVRSPDNDQISTFLDERTHAGGFVRFRPRPGYTFYLEPRLFRSDPSIRFNGRIHETHVPDMNAFANRHDLQIARTPLVIEHYGYEGDQTKKIARNLPLLQAEVAARPERAYLWHHLAEMLAAAGHSREAIEACERGLKSAAKIESLKDATDYRELAKTLARLLIKRGQSARVLVDRHLSEAPQDWSLLYLKGRCDLIDSNSESALAIGHRLSSIDPEDLPDGLVAYDQRLFKDLAWELIGAAHLSAGHRCEAAEAFHRAFALAPNNTSYYVKAVVLDAGSTAHLHEHG